jgi:outer membrane protein insertion porin family
MIWFRNILKNYRIIVLFTGILLTSVLPFQNWLFSQSEKFYGQKITKIDFKGNLNIKSPDLLNLIQSRPGMILTSELVNADLKAIFAHGSVAYARIEGETYKDGVSIAYVIEEKPIVTSVTFRGIKELSESTLVDLIPLKADKVFSETLLLKSVDLVIKQAHEKGLLNASVTYEKKTDPKKGNAVTVMFTVDEGEEIKVGMINFVGLKNIDRESLYGLLKIQEETLFTKGEFQDHLYEQDKRSILEYFNQKGFLDARLLDVKKEIKWNNPVKQDKRVIVITYKIDEGEQSYFNGYDINWDEKYINNETKTPIYVKNDFEKFFEQTEGYLGKAFDNSKYNRDKGIISYRYNEKGYIYARSFPEKTIIRLNEDELNKYENSEIQKEQAKIGKDYYNISLLRKIYEKEPEKRNRQFIHTRFLIQEGIKGYIEGIVIKGNEKTSDKVIRREFLVKEGDLFNASLVQRSREKIFNLGFFSEVNLDARPGSKEGFMNLVVTVAEQLTGSMSVGGGYGTLTGFSIFMQLQETNLNGTGQNVSGKLEFGLKRTAINVSWTEPWMFDKPWSVTFGGEFFHAQLLTSTINPLSYQSAATNPTSSSSSSSTSSVNLGSAVNNISNEDAFYYRDKIGVVGQIGHQLGVNWRHYHGLNPSFSQITNPSAKVDDIVYLEAALGWQFQNKLINGLLFDNRDNVFNTTQGMNFKANIDFVGGVLGGTDHFNRYNFSASFYWWPTDFTFFNSIRIGELRKWRIVFEHHISATLTQQSEPVYDNQDIFENPYIQSFDRLYLGGFEGLRGWEAYDAGFPAYWNQNGGASHRLLLDTELRIPIEPSLIWAVLFFDMGALFNETNQYYMDETTPQNEVDALNATRLTVGNLFDLSYYRYSIGFGVRLQIPVMPIRLYFAQRLLWSDKKGWFINDPSQSELEVVFAIGDYRF